MVSEQEPTAAAAAQFGFIDVSTREVRLILKMQRDANGRLGIRISQPANKVTAIAPGSPAGQEGLIRQGDRVLAIDGQPPSVVIAMHGTSSNVAMPVSSGLVLHRSDEPSENDAGEGERLAPEMQHELLVVRRHSSLLKSLIQAPAELLQGLLALPLRAAKVNVVATGTLEQRLGFTVANENNVVIQGHKSSDVMEGDLLLSVNDVSLGATPLTALIAQLNAEGKLGNTCTIVLVRRPKSAGIAAASVSTVGVTSAVTGAATACTTNGASALSSGTGTGAIVPSRVGGVQSGDIDSGICSGLSEDGLRSIDAADGAARTTAGSAVIGAAVLTDAISEAADDSVGEVDPVKRRLALFRKTARVIMTCARKMKLSYFKAALEVLKEKDESKLEKSSNDALLEEQAIERVCLCLPPVLTASFHSIASALLYTTRDVHLLFHLKCDGEGRMPRSGLENLFISLAKPKFTVSVSMTKAVVCNFVQELCLSASSEMISWPNLFSGLLAIAARRRHAIPTDEFPDLSVEESAAESLQSVRRRALAVGYRQALCKVHLDYHQEMAGVLGTKDLKDDEDESDDGNEEGFSGSPTRVIALAWPTPNQLHPPSRLHARAPRQKSMTNLNVVREKETSFPGALVHRLVNNVKAKLDLVEDDQLPPELRRMALNLRSAMSMRDAFVDDDASPELSHIEIRKVRQCPRTLQVTHRVPHPVIPSPVTSMRDCLATLLCSSQLFLVPMHVACTGRGCHKGERRGTSNINTR